MRQFSISRLMLIVGMMAANFAAIRLLLRGGPASQPFWQLLAGLLPLTDALLVSSYLAASRYRIGVRWGSRRAGVFHAAFAAGSGVLILLSVASWVWAKGLLFAYVELVGQPFVRAFRSLKVDTTSDTAMNRYVLGGTFIGLVISGPLLSVAALGALVFSRVELIVEPRQQVPG